MEENKNKLRNIIESIDDSVTLGNLVIIVTDYISYYSDQKRKSEADL